jgi:hypothetical protein
VVKPLGEGAAGSGRASQESGLSQQGQQGVRVWSLGGQPVALTAAPYGMDEDERAELEEWVEEYPDPAVAYGTGWYGADTTQVLLWRRDRIPAFEPA